MMERSGSPFYVRLLLLLLAIIENVTTSATGCSSKRFREAIGTKEKDDYLIYGLTQDCQLFFVRSYQLDYLNSIQVDPQNAYCSPSSVQLHVSSANTILLLMRQGPTRVCTLELNIPPPEILFGTHVFRYSLVTAIRFLVCSHTQEFHLDPAQTFLDTAFQDVIYAIDGDSKGPQWIAKQLVLRNGTLRLLGSVIMDYSSLDRKSQGMYIEAREFVIGSDATRKSLTVVNRHNRTFTRNCLFDLLFRPHAVKIETGQIENPFGGGATLHSVSTDSNILLIGEEKRAGPYTTSTFLYAMNLSESAYQMSCIAQVNFAADVGIIRVSTLKAMTDNPLPKFSPHKQKTLHHRISEEYRDDGNKEQEAEDERKENEQMNKVHAGEQRNREQPTQAAAQLIKTKQEDPNAFSVEVAGLHEIDPNDKETDNDDEEEEPRYHQGPHDNTGESMSGSFAEKTTTQHERRQKNPIPTTTVASKTAIAGDSLPPKNDTLTSISPRLSANFYCASLMMSAFFLLAFH